MVRSAKIERFRFRLGMHHCFYNCNNKIWLFWTSDIQLDILEEAEQYVTCKVTVPLNPAPIHITIVYAKCTREERRHLWDDLRNWKQIIQGPWGVMGDFNVILEAKEKKKGQTF